MSVYLAVPVLAVILPAVRSPAVPSEPNTPYTKIHPQTAIRSSLGNEQAHAHYGIGALLLEPW